MMMVAATKNGRRERMHASRAGREKFVKPLPSLLLLNVNVNG